MFYFSSLGQILPESDCDTPYVVVVSVREHQVEVFAGVFYYVSETSSSNTFYPTVDFSIFFLVQV